MSPGAPLLGPSITGQTPETFLAQVTALHRAPERRQARPKTPKLKGRWLDRGTLKREGRYEITLGALSTTLGTRLARFDDGKRLTTVGDREFSSALDALQVKPDALRAFLGAKNITVKTENLPL